MKNWLIRSLPLLGLIVAATAALVTVLELLVAFATIAAASKMSGWGPMWLLVWACLKLAAIGLAYGLFVRLLTLCDDVATLRRARMG
jgi:hypothetical protein